MKWNYKRMKDGAVEIKEGMHEKRSSGTRGRDGCRGVNGNGTGNVKYAISPILHPPTD